MYPKLVTVSNFRPFTLISVYLVLFVIRCCLSSAWSFRHWFPYRRLLRLCQDAQLILPVFLPLLLSHRCHQQRGVLTVPSWSSTASVMILSRNMLKRVGESRHPCQTPTVVRNQSPMLLLKRTALVALSWKGFDDSDKVGADVILLHGCPQSCMPSLSKPSWSLWLDWIGLIFNTPGKDFR